MFGVVVGTNITDHLRKSGRLGRHWWDTPWWARLIRCLVSVSIAIAISFAVSLMPLADEATEYTMKYAVPYFVAPVIY
jgi:hypothetical protein